MSRRIAVLRPQPGAEATLARLAAAGLDGFALPLFEVVALAWQTPTDLDRYAALAVTSANAIRHAGPVLAALSHFPVHAVGEATAAAARDAGLKVAAVGEGDAAALFAAMARAGIGPTLWIAGADRTPVTGPAPALGIIETYAARPASIDAAALARLEGALALLHSRRAAARLADLMSRDSRAGTAIAAISSAVAAAAGDGWASIDIAASPDDAALIARAIDRVRADADKPGR